MSVRNVLVFPAGTEIGLEIHQALSHCKEVRLFGAGVGTPNHGPFAFERHFSLPLITEPNWLEELIALCQKLSIDYIFPAYDDVIVALANAQQYIPAVVLTAPLDACLVTRSKRATYAALQNMLRVPKIFDDVPDAKDYPLIVKPDRGQGSQGVALVRTQAELVLAMGALSEPLVCEFLPGDEFTVDCFSDRDRGVLFAGARARRRTRNGISVNTVTVEIDDVDEMARSIQAAFQLRGAWFFQMKRATDGRLSLL
ncbi:MAG: ATP-grasp domain-containing protein, partial [Azonexus sp.]|nr:ATP-grasp domain-containing protein [Azonexus sp.]